MKQVHVRSCPLFTTWHHVISVCCYIQAELYRFLQANSPRISITEETRKAFSVNSKMEEILDIIFKAYSHSIISLEDFTDTTSRSIEGKKAETLKLSCQYFFIQCPNSCKWCVCIYVCVFIYIHPSMMLQPLLGPSLPQMTSPFLSSARGMRACAYMSTFRFGCAKCWNHSLSQSIQDLPHYYYTIQPIPYAMELE